MRYLPLLDINRCRALAYKYAPEIIASVLILAFPAHLVRDSLNHFLTPSEIRCGSECFARSANESNHQQSSHFIRLSNLWFHRQIPTNNVET
jgi:hypothetical protein